MAQANSPYRMGSGGRPSWSKEISFYYILGKALQEVLRSGGNLFILKQFSLVAALNDFSQDQYGDDKIKGGLTHGLNFVASQFQVSQVPAFTNQQYPHNKENEESKHFIHSVALEELSYPVGKQDHD